MKKNYRIEYVLEESDVYLANYTTYYKDFEAANEFDALRQFKMSNKANDEITMVSSVKEIKDEK